MSSLSPQERLQRVLQKKTTDRPPVICPGGMMNAAIVDVMNQTGHTLPEGHHDAQKMAQIALDIHDYTGFENLGIPFCMTVEAEVLGADVDYGTLACEPKIARELFASADQVQFRDGAYRMGTGRTATVIQAAYHLHRARPDVPIVGNLTGPISTAASIIDPMNFFKELRKNKAQVHRVLDYVSRHLVEFAQELIDNGATVISIGDPTATGEILGPKCFEEFAVPYLNQVIDGIHAVGAPVIVHICGDMKAVRHLIPAIRSDAISTDAMVSLRRLKEDFPALTTMGNLSTYLLEFGSADQVARQAEQLVRDQVDIIAPACGLSTSTSIAKIQALTETVRGGARGWLA
ncbi:uroporphyrinogen decarboxylase family protein [Heliophilum fasciatum]|uniref:[methyl-Co(III) methanol-specific corrinoid protein]:coenzyme M methyltransferase n=1 Tax=Heliophilum fasciatum TaxID=35700 RepID=A0A4V6NRT4_9FIRM|nr:uroporphyrinogen decarboxylase family protein [Heliophilum fasciatum]MCW2276653.1 [methyl-Co(III) methanol-specific corrinoid protein]:coenzyme M methyltransferase [Heliophilum fasciatum]TCP68966.1 [methyl-Co(III) methanol-specific corrinoid protein]:coenzyme M methyltransferase [Heliophilum fasciatum]